MKILENFTNLYSLSKTLKFELKPCLPDGINETQKERFLESFWDNYLGGPLFQHDNERNESYPIVKELLDILHRRFIKDALETFECDNSRTWGNLYNKYLADKKSKEFAALQKGIREDIVKHFKAHVWWPYINSYKELIEEIIPQLVTNDDDFLEEANERLGLQKEALLLHLNNFKRFSVYFGKYKENRDNMYKSDDQGTAIANRIVNENFPKFADNISVYKKLKENCVLQLEEVEANLTDYLDGKRLDNIFIPDHFNECLTQTGIVRYNWILGGNPNEGVIGINDVGNKYIQHNPQTSLRLKDLRMAMLYKQILSDKEQISYLPQQFANGKDGEQEMITAIEQFSDSARRQDLFGKVSKVFAQIASNEVDTNKIYVVGGNLTSLSKMLYGSWNALGEALRKHFVTGTSKKVRQELDKDISEWISNKAYSLADIIAVEAELLGEHTTSISKFLTTLSVNKWDNETKSWRQSDLLTECQEAYATTFLPVVNHFKAGNDISSNDSCKESIKAYLDRYMEILHACEIFRLGKKEAMFEKDSIYTEYNSLFESTETEDVTLSDIIPLYNKVRNFLTRKVADEGKMLLKFDSPTLADGWDSNMELANNAIILIKDGKYFLLVLNPNNKPNLSLAINGNNGYQKMVYHQIGNVAADIPNLMIIDGKTEKKTGRKDKKTGENKILEELKNKYLPEDINRIRISQSFSKLSPNFNQLDSQRYIEYYKQRLIDYKKGDIDFHFKDSSEYESYSDFLDDVAQQKFSISFVNYDEDVVKSWVESNQVFLFQIFNKDFLEGAHGTENMHTLYWREIFSPRNMISFVYKLNGKAEFFFRRKLLASSYTHKKSSILVNKTYADGTPIAPVDYLAFVKYFNREVKELTDEQVKLLPQVKTNRAKIDIVKDKRYTEHKFMFHVPITINFKAESLKSEKQFNEYTLSQLREHRDEINIIGIDRGERNLIYVSVINQRGENITPLKHFNLIETPTYEGNKRQFNYLEKLKQVEGDRDEARKNWAKIENIKELKSGYLSQVIHEISKLVVKYNAIIVLEDLNFGFKRGRFNVERQVYQNFEKMLIQKLNFLVFKKDSPSANFGNIHNGLQLTAPFTSFKDLGKQSGWLFYVPAEYTSKIDAKTGFVNLFNMRKAAEKPVEFFSAFNSIEYRDGMFYFSFDYSNENLPTVKSDFTNLWTLSSHGHRIAMIKNIESQRMEPKDVDLTEEIKSIFKDKIELCKLSIDTLVNHPEAEKLCKELFYKFKLLLQMRNSKPNDATIDYLISPVASSTPFITGRNNEMGIKDADANGAYHIALKGLYLLENDFPKDGEYLRRITTADWLKFVQMHTFRN